jgi:hypothetical protein
MYDVNQAQSASEGHAIRVSVKRGIRYETDSWITRHAVRLHLERAFRPRAQKNEKRLPISKKND